MFSSLIEEGCAGREYLDRVTDLLVRARAEDPGGGPWDAADLQWWARSGHYEDAERLRFWSEPGSRSCVCALFPTVANTIALSCLWLSSARDIALHRVLPAVLSNVQTLARDGGLSVEIEALDRDTEWRRLLESRGFEPVSGGSSKAMLRTSSAAARPWRVDGLRICDDTQRAPNAPHPLERRCGPEIRQRLQGCSLYRPELDLSVRSTAGEAVAYCLCWVDDTNRFAMLEPMRTEPAWQGRGLATALIAEQARRLSRLGIEHLEVNYATDNRAAQRLYAGSNFALRFERVAYRWSAAR